ncbi:MAG: PQQ-dependent sugar dehydrogenase [Xanthomonadales bacterium]|nr:PQQ-dependent sugar dehydrogenase [Xanthomonadales bacterium]
MTRLFAFVLALVPLAVAAEDRHFDSEKGRLQVTRIAGDLAHPWGMAFLPDGRMLVTERPGRLRIVTADGQVSEPVAGVPEVHARGQGGLLDVALDPGFAGNGLVYLSYAMPEGRGAATAVARGRLDGEALVDVQRVWVQQPAVSGVDVHFGSRLVFARDGRLFVTTGDRNQRADAQRLDRGQGKVVRIESSGMVPADNPFASRRDALAEVWSYGHRNIQGAALHPATGELWTHEHGPRGGDEINIARAGRNYGWPVIGAGINYSGRPIPETEGTEREGMEQPLHLWNPSIAPSGMAFYEHDRFPAWRGNLFVGALAFQLVARLELDGERVVHEERILLDLRQRIRDVRVGPDGYLYLLTDAPRGELLRVGLVAGREGE